MSSLLYLLLYGTIEHKFRTVGWCGNIFESRCMAG